MPIVDDDMVVIGDGKTRYGGARISSLRSSFVNQDWTGLNNAELSAVTSHDEASSFASHSTQRISGCICNPSSNSLLIHMVVNLGGMVALLGLTAYYVWPVRRTLDGRLHPIHYDDGRFSSQPAVYLRLISTSTGALTSLLGLDAVYFLVGESGTSKRRWRTLQLYLIVNAFVAVLLFICLILDSRDLSDISSDCSSDGVICQSFVDESWPGWISICLLESFLWVFNALGVIWVIRFLRDGVHQIDDRDGMLPLEEERPL